MNPRTSTTPVTDAIASLVDSAAAASAGRIFTLLHLGCGVPLFLRRWEAVRAGRIAYRGFDESRDLVREAADEFPSLRFVCRQLDSMPRLDADVVIIGQGIFRLCGGGAGQLLANAARGRWGMLLVATVPGADNAGRERLIGEPRVPVPLDVVVGGFLAREPAAVIADRGCPVAYAVWHAAL